MIDKVAEFHVKNSHPIRDTPGHISDHLKMLRLRLIVEEAAELAIAMHKNDIIAVADAIADLLYVTIGAALAYGIPIQEVFDEVHRANMSKGKLDEQQKGGKNVEYSPPDVEAILLKHGWDPKGW
jgi:predicted HAD superfamily Cof-like phosphohydrolase